MKDLGDKGLDSAPSSAMNLLRALDKSFSPSGFQFASLYKKCFHK